MFKPILLETNHRQGKDKAYAELLNRVRVGKQTKEDMKLLRTRVRPEHHPDIKMQVSILYVREKTVQG